MRKKYPVECLTLQFGALDIWFLRPVVVGHDGKLLSTRQAERDFIKQRAADQVIRVAGANRIETDSAENIPRGSLARVFIATKTIRGRLVKKAHHLTHAGLGLPRLADIIVK